MVEASNGYSSSTGQLGKIYQNSKWGIPFEPTIPLLQILSSTFVRSGVWTRLFTAALLVLAKYLKQLQGSSKGNISKLLYLYTVGFYTAMEKEFKNSSTNVKSSPRHIVKCRKRKGRVEFVLCLY